MGNWITQDFMNQRRRSELRPWKLHGIVVSLHSRVVHWISQLKTWVVRHWPKCTCATRSSYKCSLSVSKLPFYESVSEWESVCYGMNCPATLHVNDRISSPSDQKKPRRTAHKKHVYKSSLCKYSPHINSYVLFHIFPWKKLYLSRWAAPSHVFYSRSRHQLISPTKINRETPVHSWYALVYLLVFDLI